MSLDTVSIPDFLEVSAQSLPPRLLRWKNEIASAALAATVCPFLVTAVVDRESGGVPDVIGSDGHGRGLMQIDDRSHKTFCAAVFDDGTPLWKLPAFNLLYGASFLARLLKSFGGDPVAAVAAYNAGAGAVRKVLAKFPPVPTLDERADAIDAITTGGNYAHDVMRRRTNLMHLT